ncbi:hypothetical protein K8I31_14290, partial [bacterium]|nr:hypothetical protein [bacterium]
MTAKPISLFLLFAVAALFAVTGATQPMQDITDPAITAWKINTTGETGTSIDPDIDAVVSQILADVQKVSFNDEMVYIESTGVPSHTVGPFNDNNPAYPGDQEHIFVVPRTAPGKATNEEAIGLGAVGFFVNGVPLYSYSDAESYNDMGIWNQVAIVSIGLRNGWDSGNGHPAPGTQRDDDGGMNPTPPNGGGNMTPTPGGNMQPTPPNGGGDMPTPPDGGMNPTPPDGGGNMQ